MKLIELLEKKFNEFVLEAKRVIGDTDRLLQDVTNIDYIEVVDVVLFLFPDDNIPYHLDELLQLKSISLSDGEKEDLYPIIEKYLVFLRKVQPMLKS